MSSSSATRVADIFNAAGFAFTKLGELSMTLHETEESSGAATGRWDAEDIKNLQLAVKRFGEDLNKISENIKNKTIAQIKAGIKRKAVDDSASKLVATTTTPNKKLMTSPVSSGPATASVTIKTPKSVKTTTPTAIVNNIVVNNETNHNSGDDSLSSLSNSHVKVFDS
ncbi:chromatin complexes subunit BAP18-like [Oppia nitens]|uniref:chromatin complexes subunit BAP18-like n=1 Tax=Oppia nitens TaxID=1686743 RepID=UPI0023DA9F21|nr:chromatin complexes subunit BAP18-like [Oppia nitens]